ncbi:NUDIX domain-containing protein [Candidatus Saccharibacteria bacterium]|nr:MAG: NUDIX domain-containing protein [Candidatus Saccharibacteria bacterium]
MIEFHSIEHHIQRHIMGYLMHHETARFRDLRPPRVDTNLFSYHLKLLQKSHFVEKGELGYTLGAKGLQYVDRVTADKMRVRTQPKIITMLLVQDGYGKVLLQKRDKQPYINTWTLPYGKLHIDDVSVLAAARREANEKLSFDPHKLSHVGDCYIRVMQNDEVESTTLVHVVRFETDAVLATDSLQWVEPLELSTLRLAPAVEKIVTRAFFGDDFFFEEFVA